MVKFNFLLLTIALVASFFLTTTVEAVFNASNVPEEEKNIWCSDQQSQCILVCQDSGNQNEINTCDPVTLDWNCICSNGLAPNTTRYTLPIPFFKCSYDQQECVSHCATGNSGCQDSCDKHCGALAPGPTGTASRSAISTATQTSLSSNTQDASPTPTGNIISEAIKLPSAAINASFVIFLTAVFLMFTRL